MKLSSECVGDWLSNARFTDAGWPNEAEDRALEAVAELPDGEVLEDASFDFVQGVVIGIQVLEQCDEIWRNCPTLATKIKPLASLRGFIKSLAKFWAYFG